MLALQERHLEFVFDKLHWALLDAPAVDVGEWQALDVSGKPELITRELMNVSFEAPVPASADELGTVTLANLPWAEDQFQERVGREPVNPGETYKEWPYYRGNVEQHQTEEAQAFTHTYMERFWPLWAGLLHQRDLCTSRDLSGVEDRHDARTGIRYRYGDLDDVVELLHRSPRTRQAWFPIFFPEDTGAVHRGRIPCTLGYQFLLREEKLHIIYVIRSCDFIRHFRDDVYMACRLLHWVLRELRKKEPDWEHVEPGNITMHMFSLHVFSGDMPKLEREAP